MGAKRASDAPRREIRPATWALIATAGVSLLLTYAGFRFGNWRGVVVTELQVLAVGCAAWYGLRR